MEAPAPLQRMYNRAYLLSGGNEDLAAQAVRRAVDIISSESLPASEVQDARSGPHANEYRGGGPGDDGDGEGEGDGKRESKKRKTDDTLATLDPVRGEQPSIYSVLNLSELTAVLVEGMNERDRAALRQTATSARKMLDSVRVEENKRILVRSRYGDFDNPIDWFSATKHNELGDLADRIFRLRMRRQYLAGDIFENAREVAELAMVMGGLEEGNILPYLIWHFEPADVTMLSLSLPFAAYGNPAWLAFSMSLRPLTVQIIREILDRTEKMFKFVCQWRPIDADTKTTIELGISLYRRVLNCRDLINDELEFEDRERLLKVMKGRLEPLPGSFEEPMLNFLKDLDDLAAVSVHLLKEHNSYKFSLVLPTMPSEVKYIPELTVGVKPRENVYTPIFQWHSRIASLPQYGRFCSSHDPRLPRSKDTALEYLRERAAVFQSQLQASINHIDLETLIDVPFGASSSSSSSSSFDSFDAVWKTIVVPLHGWSEDVNRMQNRREREEYLRTPQPKQKIKACVTAISEAQERWLDEAKRFSDIERCVIIEHLKFLYGAKRVKENYFISFDAAPRYYRSKLILVQYQKPTDRLYDPTKTIEYLPRAFLDIATHLATGCFYRVQDSLLFKRYKRGRTSTRNLSFARASANTWVEFSNFASKGGFVDSVIEGDAKGREYENMLTLVQLQMVDVGGLKFEERALYEFKNEQAPNVIKMPKSITDFVYNAGTRVKPCWDVACHAAGMILLTDRKRGQPPIFSENSDYDSLRIASLLDVQFVFGNGDARFGELTSINEPGELSFVYRVSQPAGWYYRVAYEIYLLLYCLNEWPYELPPNFKYYTAVYKAVNKTSPFLNMVRVMRLLITRAAGVTASDLFDREVHSIVLAVSVPWPKNAISEMTGPFEALRLLCEEGMTVQEIADVFPSAQRKFMDDTFVVELKSGETVSARSSVVFD